ncbi:guanylin-like [Mobula hypostoma]|uniref:guanylin-like n=1 Tax=Mobula hypostoma TaxID=723540 RepID=UPI002FC37338
MKLIFSLALALSCLPNILANVMVQEGNYTFPLEDVKQLWAVMGTLDKYNPAVASSISTGLCASSELPKVLQPICTSKDADQVFFRLVKIAVRSDECEICVHPACTDC